MSHCEIDLQICCFDIALKLTLLCACLASGICIIFKTKDRFCGGRGGVSLCVWASLSYDV